VDLGLDGTMIQWCPNAFSSGLLGTGTSIDGWILTEEGIYYVSDIFGTLTVDKQFDFAADGVNGTETYRNIDASFAEEGFVIVVTHYQDDGTYACVTTDGENWSEGAITTHHDNNYAYYHMPAIYVSSKTPGYALSAAFTTTSTDPEDCAPSAYVTTTYGASWSTASGYQLFGALGATFVGPWDDNPDDDVFYYNRKYTWDGYKQTYDLYKNDGGSHSDISPAADAGTRIGRYSISSCPLNRQRLAVIAQKSYSSTPYERYGLYVSENEGSSWTARTAISSSFQGRGVAISGDNEDIMYLWGTEGYLQYSEDFGATFVDKSGNIDTTGRLIGVLGGLS